MAGPRTGDRPGRFVRRERYHRQWHPRPIVELVGESIARHGLTDEVRLRAVCLSWREIAGDRVGAVTFPLALVEGVLHVATGSSSWVQEMRYHAERLVTRINGWIDENRVWLGPPPLVAEIRCSLERGRRDGVVDREHVDRLRARHLRRMRRPSEVTAPVASAADHAAILAETCTIVDAELRAAIERVRLKWNR